MICLVCLIRCGIEINTSDPQFSGSIEESKEDSLFLFELTCTNSGNNIFKFDKAWIEYSWKNEVKWGKRIKKRTDGVQLVIQISEYLDSFFVRKSYVLNWTMKYIDKDDTLGQYGDQYFLLLNDNELRDKYSIEVLRKKNEIRVDTIAFSVKK